MKNKRKNIAVKALILLMFSFFSTHVFAAGPPAPSELSKPVAELLLVVIVALLIVIVLLANIVIGAAGIQVKKHKSVLQQLAQSGNAVKTVLFILFSFSAISVFAAGEPAAVPVEVPANYGGLSAVSFWALLSVIVLEVIIILGLAYNLKFLLRLEKNTLEVPDATGTSIEIQPESSWKIWWDKVNSFRPMKEEAQIDLGHNYDGIRELDNRLPPWWLYGFYICIIFAGIYLYRYHVAHSAPLSIEELKIAMDKGDEEKKAYLKQSANNIDETNVVLLTASEDLDAAKKIFTGVCATCHKADGGGLVGPNLTDDYWIHGGTVQEVFKTIKYGVPEKGMQSWKDSYSPKQIAQLASYIKSIHGTKPAGGKEPQGILFEEKAVIAKDSAKVKVDSIAKKSAK
jgi:cytochrome c oxidase cbb3-type subunit 3